MKTLKVTLLVILLAGCTAFDTLGDYINENQLLTSITTRQVVGRYIAAGDTLEAEKQRAQKVQETLTKVLDYVNGEPLATVSGLLLVVDRSINWDDLNTPDKMLVMDIMEVLKAELSNYQAEDKINKNSQIAIRGLFETAISAAKVYLVRM